ncbi:MAG: metallophosphoesterase [Bacteroidales bacterium]|nr:metallophosphoesterase [Bacteroidales bacterium]
MRIQYASDLHLEFSANTDFLAANPLKPVGDILVLAGDITLFGKSKLRKHPFFDWCEDNFTQTFIIPGNHEYYEGVELSQSQVDFDSPLRDNVRYINNKSVVIGDVELFFTTLWSPIEPTHIVPVQMGMTDCYRIKYQGRSFNANDYATLHSQSLSFLQEVLAKSQTKHKVVVTHHCPTLRFADPRFPGSTINSAFCVNLDQMIEDSCIECWIYGHTHYNGGADQMIGSTLMLTNQLGYVKHGEHGAFRKDAVVEVLSSEKKTPTLPR